MGVCAAGHAVGYVCVAPPVLGHCTWWRCQWAVMVRSSTVPGAAARATQPVAAAAPALCL
jgi:hypothetical protein